MAKEAHPGEPACAVGQSGVMATTLRDRSHVRDDSNGEIRHDGRAHDDADISTYTQTSTTARLPRRRTVDLRVPPPTGPWARRWDMISRIWDSRVALSVPHEASRDNLANERTYLAYLRTSLSMSMMGITITQVLRLERQLVTLPRFTYFILGKPLGLLFQVAAMTVALTGAYRFRRQQMSMERGKVWAGGWEIHLIMMFLFALMIGVFALFVVADVLQPLGGRK